MIGDQRTPFRPRPATTGGRVIPVGLGELEISKRTGDTLSTRSLGACIAIAVWDKTTGLAGLLHPMLPRGDRSDRRAKDRPALFVDTGIVEMLERIIALGGRLDRAVAKIAGGAAMFDADGVLDLGRRNHEQVLIELEHHRIPIVAQQIGGNISWQAALHITTGALALRAAGREQTL